MFVSYFIPNVLMLSLYNYGQIINTYNTIQKNCTSVTKHVLDIKHSRSCLSKWVHLKFLSTFTGSLQMPISSVRCHLSLGNHLCVLCISYIWAGIHVSTVYSINYWFFLTDMLAVEQYCIFVTKWLQICTYVSDWLSMYTTSLMRISLDQLM